MRGARTETDHLNVWMNGVRVGAWTRRSGAPDRFAYDDAWVESPAARVLSLSLPFLPENAPQVGAAVGWFFDNLLPDHEVIRRRVQARFGTETDGAFDLLSAIGRDCVGAVQLLPPGEAPAGIETLKAEPLAERDVEAIIEASLVTGGGATENPEHFRISLAGAQEKTALLWHGGRWCRPLGTTPTTHIFKLPLGLVGNLGFDLHDSVENEWLCGRLLAEFGLPVASSEIAHFGRRKVLVVERFDRLPQEDGWIARRPQEDFCQALGVPGLRKYEIDGGPGIGDMLRVLAGGARPEEDARMFLRAQIAFWLLAAIDGHAKNFSIFHERGGTYRMAPFYDVLSAWPMIGRGRGKLELQKVRMAMAVRSKNAHWKLDEIRPAHWSAVARRAGLGDADDLLHAFAESGDRVLAKVARSLPRGFPETVSEPVFRGVERGLRGLATQR